MGESRARAGSAAHLVLSASAGIGKGTGVCWHSPLTPCLWLTPAAAKPALCTHKALRSRTAPACAGGELAQPLSLPAGGERWMKLVWEQVSHGLAPCFLLRQPLS